MIYEKIKIKSPEKKKNSILPDCTDFFSLNGVSTFYSIYATLNSELLLRKNFILKNFFQYFNDKCIKNIYKCIIKNYPFFYIMI